MLRLLLKKWFSTGLTSNDSPSFFEVLCGLVTRCFWTFLVGALISSFVWCVVCLDWNGQTQGLIAEGFVGAAKSMTSDREASIVLELPGRQAQYWLQQVENQDAAGNLSANELMGAALVLDHPSQAYLSSEFATKAKKRYGEDVFAVLGREHVEFEHLCFQSCLSLAKRATEANPHDTELHRVRAMLLFHPSSSSPEFPIRSDSWMQILSVCSQHDPDNGLYDYLAAVECWRTSAEIDFGGDRDTLIVSDRPLYELGWTHFQRAQQCRTLVFPSQQLSLAMQFATQADCSPIDAARVVWESQIQTRILYLTRRIGRMLLAQAGDYETDGDIDAAVTTCVFTLHFAEQWDCRPWTLEGWVPQWFRHSAQERLNQIAAVCPEQTARFQLPNLRQLAFETRLERLKLAKFLDVLEQRSGTQGPSQTKGVADVVLACCPLLYGGIALLIASGCFWLSSKIKSGKRVANSDWNYLLCFSLTFGLSAFFLGVVPAKIVSLDTARVMLVVIGFLFYVLIAAFLCRRWFFTPNREPPINGLLMVPATFVFGAGWLAVTVVASQYFVEPDSAIDNLSGFLRLPILVPTGGQKVPDWAKFLVEWSSNNGPSIGILLGMLASTLWCSRLVVLHNRDKTWPGTSLVKTVLLNCVKPLFVVGCLFSTISMYGLPATVRNTITWHQFRMTYCDNDEFRIVFDQAAATVERDIPLMQQLRAEADAYADRFSTQ